MKRARTQKVIILGLALLASACSNMTERPTEEPDNATAAAADKSVEDPTREREIAQPIRVGDNGPRFPACSSTGQVSGVDQDDPLEVRSAPFERAQVTGTLTNGQKLFICMNSLDRKWFGVVYAGEGLALSECGVASPIRVAGEYGGPCDSGWVSSAFIRLGAR